MLAFVKKNFWLWRPTRSGNLYIFGLALAISFLDARFHLPTELWAGICALVVVLAQAGAASAMNDFHDDSYHFLEYLPIRWSHVWFASWLDNLLSALLVVPLLCWHRVLTWTAPLASLSAPADPLFAMRWSLPIGLFCGVYFSFNYALIGRSIFKSAKATLLVMLGGQIVFFAGAAVMLVFAMVLPGSRELCPLLLIQGTLFAGCSYLILVMPPRYWPTWRRIVFVALPTMLITTVLFFSILHIECRRWQRLDWSEPGLTPSASVLPGDHPMVIAEVVSQRSMAHYFACDPQSGNIRFIGRNLERLVSRPAWAGEDSAVFKHFSLPVDWWPMPAPLIAIKGDQQPPVKLLADASIIDSSGRRLPVVSATVLHAGRYMIIATDYQSGTTTVARVLGPDGRVEKQFDVGDRANHQVLVSKSGRLVTVAASRSPSTDSGCDYFLYESDGGTETKFKLPGNPVCFSPDLTACACLIESPNGVMNDRQVVLAAVPGGSQRIVIPAGILPSVPASVTTYLPPLPWRSSLGGGCEIGGDTSIIFDGEFRQADVLLPRFENNLVHHSIVHVDLATGSRRTLVEEFKIPVTIFSSPMLNLNTFSFSRDGRACFYQTGQSITRILMPTSESAPAAVSEIRLPSNSTQVQYSPSGGSVLLCEEKSMPDGALDRRTQWVAFDRPDSPVELPADLSYQFVDEQHLVGTTASRVTITDLQGHMQRQLLPPAEN